MKVQVFKGLAVCQRHGEVTVGSNCLGTVSNGLKTFHGRVWTQDYISELVTERAQEYAS